MIKIRFHVRAVYNTGACVPMERPGRRWQLGISQEWNVFLKNSTIR